MILAFKWDIYVTQGASFAISPRAAVTSQDGEKRLQMFSLE